MHPKLRNFFDEHLRHVLAGLPQRVLKLLDEMPLHVEDYPSDQVMRDLNITDRSILCGLYTGIPITERSEFQGVHLPDVVTIYREGIFRESENENGDLSEAELVRQIKITVLHEIAHHHGFSEEELVDLGYG